MLKLITALLTVFSLQLALPAQATTFGEQPFTDTVQDAPVIVRGKVGTSYSNWSDKRIYTYFEILEPEFLKGKKASSGTSIMARQLGGEKDGMGMEIPGSAKFQKGEDVVIILNEAGPDGSYHLRGLMMSKLQLEKGEDGKEYVSGPAIRSSDLSSEDSHANQADPRLSLESLKKIIATQRAQPSPSPSVASPPNHSPTPLATSPVLSAAPGLQPAPTANPTEGVVTPSANNGGFSWPKALVTAALVIFVVVYRIRRRGSR